MEVEYFQILLIDVTFLSVTCLKPGKHKTFVKHLYNVGPTSSRWSNVVQMLFKWSVFAGMVLLDLLIKKRTTG